MRFIHTSDWHLGRLFHGVHLTEDQAHLLDRFVDLVDFAQPDMVLVAGDIYDRAIPPPDAVALLDETVSRISGDLRIPIVLIAGNHDSPERIGFGSRLLARQGLHVIGNACADTAAISVMDEFGPVSICALPYAEPSVLRQKLEDQEIQDHASAMRSWIVRASSKLPADQRAILMTHAFVVGGKESESERPLAVGGTGSVDASSFERFDYVALGHLHRAQSVGADHIQYSGSLMKYSFSESEHVKSVNLVTMGRSGKVEIERVTLTPRRDVRQVKGFLSDLIRTTDSGSRDDYVMATLLDSGPVLDAMGKLREVYPNILHIERPALTSSGKLKGESSDYRRLSEQALFASFFQQVTDGELTAEQSATYAQVVERLRQEEREVVP